MAMSRTALAVAWSVFQLYTAATGLFDLLIQLPIHVAFAVALGFLTPASDTGDPPAWRRLSDPAAALLALACGAYYVVNNARLISRMPFVDEPRSLDVVVGVLFMLLLLETARRHIGPALVIMAVLFAAYAFVGPALPGFLSHGGVSFTRLVDQQVLTVEGIFGVPTLVSATFIYLFVSVER